MTEHFRSAWSQDGLSLDLEYESLERLELHSTLLHRLLGFFLMEMHSLYHINILFFQVFISSTWVSSIGCQSHSKNMKLIFLSRAHIHTLLI